MTTRSRLSSRDLRRIYEAPELVHHVTLTWQAHFLVAVASTLSFCIRSRSPVTATRPFRFHVHAFGGSQGSSTGLVYRICAIIAISCHVVHFT